MPRRFLIVIVALMFVLAACAGGDDPAPSATPQAIALSGEASEITVYSGRNESLVGPLFEQFETSTGIGLNVKYGDTAELAALISEEGDASPADLFFAQDAGALGAVQKEERFLKLPGSITEQVPSIYRAPKGEWVGVSGRARVAVHNTAAVQGADLPPSILGFTDPKWKGKVGWAPTNGSFQAFVTALRKTHGEEAARKWLTEMKANDARVYPRNDAIVLAVASGEIEVGFVNHYYLLNLRSQGAAQGAENYFFKPGDPGSLVNVAGAGILKTSKAQKTAARFLGFLLSAEAQKFFLEKTFEYPLAAAAGAPQGVPALSELRPPDVELSDLDDLKGTLDLLREVGLL